MAIDYSGYPESVRRNRESIGSQFAKMIPTSEEKAQRASLSYWAGKDAKSTMPLEYNNGNLTYTAEPGSQFQTETLTEAWNSYKSQLDNKNIKLRPNEYALFAQDYNSKMQQYIQHISMKFHTMKQSGVNKSSIRRMMEANPDLKQQLIKLAALSPEAGAAFSDYLVSGKGIAPGIAGKGGELALASVPWTGRVALQAALAAGGAKGGLGARGTAAAESLKGGKWKPFRALSERAKLIGKETPTKYFKTKGLKPKQLSSASRKASLAFTDAKKNYKGKKVPFESTAKGKNLLTKKKLAKVALSEGKAKGPAKVVQRFIKKHGVSGLIKQVAKKAGPKAAARLIGQLTLGTALTGTGIGTTAGLAMDAWAIASIAKIIGQTVTEESGGLRAPGKMIFGGEKPQPKGKATY